MNGQSKGTKRRAPEDQEGRGRQTEAHDGAFGKKDID